MFVVAQAEMMKKKSGSAQGAMLSATRADHIIRVLEIPYTLSGKKVEIPVKRLLMGIPQSDTLSTDSLRNPDSIKWFVDYAKSNPFT